MKELSIQIKVYPVSNMRQDVYRFMADEFEFTPVPESSEAGRCFNCNKDISISLPPSGVMKDFLAGRFCIVEFTDTGVSGSGTKKYPPLSRYRPI